MVFPSGLQTLKYAYLHYHEFMRRRTSQLNALVRALGCLVVVEPIKSPVMGFSEPPSETLTASCREDGLSEAIDSDFQND